MKRTWVVAPAIAVLLLLVMGGIAVATLRLVGGDPAAHGEAGPRDLCDRVDTRPLRQVQLSEPDYLRTVRQSTYEGLVTDTCQLQLQMDDVPPPAADAEPTPSRAPGRIALLSVHVTHHPDAAAAQADFAKSKRLAGDAPTDVDGLAERAYLSYDHHTPTYHEVEMVAQRGADGLTVRLYAVRDSEWSRDAVGAALTELARKVLET